MGKGLLIIISGGLLSAFILTHNAQRTAFEEDARQASYEDDVVAREIARSAMNVAGSTVRRDFESITDQSLSDMPYQGGEYDVTYDRLGADAIQVEVEGRHAGASHRISKTYRMVSPFDAAVIVEAAAATARYTGSSFEVSGLDTPPPSAGGVASGASFDQHGIKANSAAVRDVFRTALEEERVENVVGVMGDGDIVHGAFNLDVQNLYAEAKARRDLLVPGGTFAGNDVYGTVEDPAIVQIDGDARIRGTVSGVGVLLVEGALDVTGTLSWEGIVIARDESSLQVDFGGNAEIYGTLVLLQGSSSFVTPTDGRLKVRYLASDAELQASLEVKIGADAPQQIFARGANAGQEQVVTLDEIYPAGTAVDFLIGVFQRQGGNWARLYDHHGRGYEVPHGYRDAGKPYARVTKTSALSWRIEFEDLDRVHASNYGGGPEGAIDWDYDDYVMEVELLPSGDEPAGADYPWWAANTSPFGNLFATPAYAAPVPAPPGGCAAGTLCFHLFGNARVIYSSEAITRLGVRLDTIRNARRVVEADQWVM